MTISPRIRAVCKEMNEEKKPPLKWLASGEGRSELLRSAAPDSFNGRTRGYPLVRGSAVSDGLQNRTLMNRKERCNEECKF